MQQPHVAPWWELDGPRRRRARLPRRARPRSPHLDHWIVDRRRRPFAYVETYRVADDPLAAHYDAQPGDRGFHLLVGPPELLGSGLAAALVRTLVARLLAEPGGDAGRLRARRAQHADARASAARSAARSCATLDLPGRRAVLIAWTRAPAAHAAVAA